MLFISYAVQGCSYLLGLRVECIQIESLLIMPSEVDLTFSDKIHSNESNRRKFPLLLFILSVDKILKYHFLQWCCLFNFKLKLFLLLSHMMIRQSNKLIEQHFLLGKMYDE